MVTDGEMAVRALNVGAPPGDEASVGTRKRGHYGKRWRAAEPLTASKARAPFQEGELLRRLLQIATPPCSRQACLKSLGFPTTFLAFVDA